MANLGGRFDTTGQEEMSDFSALPNDNYVVAIKKSEMKQNKNKNGSYLSLQFEVKEGKFKNRILFSNLNLDHPNAEAVAMARKELTSITKACGLVAIEDSEELHGIPMVVKVIKKAATANNPEGNEIKAYSRYDGELPANTEKSESPKAGAPAGKKKVSFD